MPTIAQLPTHEPAAPHARVAPPLPLPCVPTTTEFGMRMSRHFAQCRRKGGQMAVLWLEVDGRDSQAGALTPDDREALMRVASQRLRNRVRGSDEVVRAGERSFAVLLLAAGAPEVQLVERRLLHALQGAYGVDGRQLQLDLRLGSALFPDDGRQGAELAEVARRQLR